MYKFIKIVGLMLSKIYPYAVYKKILLLKYVLYTSWLSNGFKSFGFKSILKKDIFLIGNKYISVGDNTIIGSRAVLTAWDEYGNDKYKPQITIGSNVCLGDDCHITAINKIEIGDNVLVGKKVTITDNSHGKSNMHSLIISPVKRSLYSLGPVYIEDGVWVGDKVTILPNVRIGKNSIIGANAVVTKNIPPNCIAVGIPAKIIKVIE